jgi:hypothetical protein
MKILIVGLEIEGQPKRFAFGDPARVVMHKAGTEEVSYLTPAEARGLALVLTDAALMAERDA